MIKQMGRALSRTRSSRSRSRSMSISRDGEEHKSKNKETSKALDSCRLSNESDDDLSIEDFTLSGTGFDFDFSEDGLLQSPRRQEQPKKLSARHPRQISPLASVASTSISRLDPQIDSKKDQEERRGRHVRRTRSSQSQSYSSKSMFSNSFRSMDNNELRRRRRSKSSSRSKSVPRHQDDGDSAAQLSVRVSPVSTGSRSKSHDRSRHLSREVSESRDSSELLSDGKKRKSKMEKILQLQEKNQRYKEEFRKVQKDRKALKKEIEVRKEEAACLAKEIDSHIAETTILKQKLSEALHKLDNVSKNVGRESTNSADENKTTSTGIEHLQLKISELLEQKARNEEHINELKQQVTFQMELVEGLQEENEKLRIENETLRKTELSFSQTNDEIERLKSELDITVQHASDMVKEREDAIADLLRENDEMKQIISRRENDASDASNEILLQLKQELAAAVAALEECQDRNVTLEEELEGMVQKTEELDAEQLRLRDELEGWQEKAAAAQQTVSLLENTAQDAQRRATELDYKLSELEKRYKEEQAEMELQHKTALEAIEKAAFEKAITIAENKAKAPPNPQEMMLQAAVANQQRKQAEAARSSWIGGFRLAVGSESDENISSEQKRIKELETLNTDQEEDIKKLKSELVRLRSTYNDTCYKNKKKIEQLENENQAYRLKIQALEIELGRSPQADTMYPDLISSSSNSSV